MTRTASSQADLLEPESLHMILDMLKRDFRLFRHCHGQLMSEAFLISCLKKSVLFCEEIVFMEVNREKMWSNVEGWSHIRGYTVSVFAFV